MRYFYSPLRYPGGKGKLSEFIITILKENFLVGSEYIEPYAGGASVALTLLFNEYVEKIHINDFDKSIYSFWYSVLSKTEELCKLISDTKINIEEWEKQKSIQESRKNSPDIELGFSTFFLNRCNRSGIIKGGVIGGKRQKGLWKIDARFNKSELINRIYRIARYRNKINLYNEDAVSLTNKLIELLPPKSIFYFDPPYYVKGKDLYVNFYKHNDHVKICQTIKKINYHYWIVSYDNQISIRDLYTRYRQIIYDLHYHASKPTKGEEVIIFSDNLRIPEIDNPIKFKIA